MDIDRYSSTLSAVISMCKQHVRILKGIQAGEMDFPNDLLKGQIAQIVADNLTLRAHCLFDRTSGVVSFERLADDCGRRMDAKAVSEYRREYAEIKKKHEALISRIENNRKIGIAHLQQKEKLGWDHETAEKLERIFGSENTVRAESDEFVFLTPSNFPLDETREMLLELEALLVYRVWFSKASRAAHAA